MDAFKRSVLSKEEYAKATGKDEGEDLNSDGSGTLGLDSKSDMMAEALGLVAFFEKNGLWEEKGDGESYTYLASANGMEEVWAAFSLQGTLPLPLFCHSARQKPQACLFFLCKIHF